MHMEHPIIALDQIHPVTDFVRNYKSHLGRIKETGKPEILTINGKPEYVILDAENYQMISDELERARFVKAVNQGIEEMKAGLGEPLDVAMKSLKDEFGI